MQNYKECSFGKFESAMDLIRKETNVTKIPDDILYIAYTKYRADAMQISCHSTYSASLLRGISIKRDKLFDELKRRNLL